VIKMVRKFNKKGDQLLGEHTVNGVVEILVIVILVGFVITAVILFWPSTYENYLRQANDQLNKLVIKANHVNENGEEESLDIFPPAEWYLRTFSDYDFPEGECRRKNSCLCICKTLSCNDKNAMKCEGFDFEVKVAEGIRGRASGGVMGYAPDPGIISELMRLDSVEVLKVFKEEGVVKIKR
jgi:hypothetical protein